MNINDYQVDPKSTIPTKESYSKWLEETRAEDVLQLESQLKDEKRTKEFYAPLTSKKPQKKRDPYVFTVKLQAEFCKHLAILGRFTHAARAVGVGNNTVRFHEKNNPDFNEKVIDAQQEYRDRIAAEVYRRAVEGWDEPIIGGKDKDKVVCLVRKYSDRLLEMEAKRVDPGYREKQTLNVGQQGGVIVINASPVDADEWRDKYNKQVVDVSSSARTVPKLPCN